MWNGLQTENGWQREGKNACHFSPSSHSLRWILCQWADHGNVSAFEFWRWRLITLDRRYNRSAILKNPRNGWWSWRRCWEIQCSKTSLSTHLPVWEVLTRRMMKGKVGYSIICVRWQQTRSGATRFFFLFTDYNFYAYNLSEGQRLASLPQTGKHRKTERLPGWNWGHPPWKRELDSIFFMSKSYHILFYFNIKWTCKHFYTKAYWWST